METNIEHLSWDSDFFGYQIGKLIVEGNSVVDIDKLREEAKKAKYRLIYIFSEQPLNTGLQPIDIKVIYSKTITAEDGKLPLLPQLTEVNDAVYSLSLRCGRYSRFNLDPKISKESYEKLYRRWIENSLSGISADKVFKFETEGEAVGFATISYGETSTIGLVVVNENFGRRGIATALINSVKKEAAENGSKRIEVATQKHNTEACALYEKCGFEVTNTTYIYHLWI